MKVISYFYYMEAYVVYPENKEQLSALKAFPSHAIEGMKRGLDDLDNGRKIPFSEFEELLNLDL